MSTNPQQKFRAALTKAAIGAIAGSAFIGIGAASAQASIFSFSPSSEVFAGPAFSNSTNSSVVTADFNRDGSIDAAFTGHEGEGGEPGAESGCGTESGEGCVGVLINTGNGAFLHGPSNGSEGSKTVAPYFYPAGGTPYEGTGALAVGDLNGDGLPDLVVANGSHENGGGGCAACVAILYDTGSSTKTFSAPVLLEAEFAGNPEAVAVGHFTGSSRLDLAVVTVSSGGQGEVDLFINKGNNSHGQAEFEPGPRIALNGVLASAAGITVANLAGHGAIDLAISTTPRGGTESTEACSFSDCVQTLIGTGSGESFEFKGPGTYQVSGAGQLAAAELQGGGQQAILVPGSHRLIDSSQSTSALLAREAGFELLPNLGLSTGALGPALVYDYPEIEHPSGIVVGDFDGDGVPDVAVVDSSNYGHQAGYNAYGYASKVALFDGTGGTGFSFDSITSGPSSLPQDAGVIAGADFNHDCRLDLLLIGNKLIDANPGSTFVLFNQTGPGCPVPVTKTTTTTTTTQSTSTTTTPKVEVKAARESRKAVRARIAAAGLPVSCTRSGVRLRLRINIDPRAIGSRKLKGRYVVHTQTVVTINGRRITISGKRSFVVAIPTSQFGVGHNSIRVSVSTSGSGIVSGHSSRLLRLSRCAPKAVFTG